MKVKNFARLVLIVLGCAIALCAGTIPVKFTGSTSGLGGPVNNVYYYPYQLIVNGSAVTVACDSYDLSVYLNEQWNATVNTFADLSGTLYGSGATTQYKEAAWLYSQFQATPPLTNNVNAAINYAIWDIMDPDTPTYNGGGGANTTSAYWVTEAADASNVNFSLAGFNAVNFSNFVIYTPYNGWPSGDGMPQEYIGEVPEPATVVLMLTGLLGLCFMAWKRRTLLS